MNLTQIACIAGIVGAMASVVAAIVFWITLTRKHRMKVVVASCVFFAAFGLLVVFSDIGRLFGPECPTTASLTINAVRSSDSEISGTVVNLDLASYDDFRVVVYYKYPNGNIFVHPRENCATSILPNGVWRLTKHDTPSCPEEVCAYLIANWQEIPEALTTAYDKSTFHYCATDMTIFECEN